MPVGPVCYCKVLQSNVTNCTKIANATQDVEYACTFVLMYLECEKNLSINPLNPHDALKHHFTSLKTDLIFLPPRVLERKFP